MAAGFKIGEGFVEIDTQDNTRAGLAKIRKNVNDEIDKIDKRKAKINLDIREAQQRGRQFRQNVSDEIDKVNAKKAAIDLSILKAEKNLAKLTEEAKDATEDRKLEIDAEISAARANLTVIRRDAEKLDGQRIQLEADLKNGPQTEAEILLLRQEAEKLDGRRVELEAKLKNGPETEQGVSRINKEIDNFTTRAKNAVLAATRFGATLASVSSLLGPLTNGMVAATIATGQWLAAVSPIVALLPGFGASLTFLTVTIKSMGDAFSTALKPIPEMFNKLGESAGKIAAKGVNDLAKEFVKLNTPNIKNSMDSIAKSVNDVALGFGKWLTSAEGTRAVQIIVNGVNDAVENLAPHITNLAIEFGKFIARVGDPLITGLADLMGRAADATAEWVSHLTAADVQNAFTRLHTAASLFTDKLTAAKEIVQWLGDNQGKIKAVSDALAGVGIVVGAVTGGWVAVVAGAVTIILNHFTTIKDAASGLWDSLSGVFNRIINDPWVQKIAADIREIVQLIQQDFADGIDYLKQKWDELSPAVEDAWNKIGPMIHDLFANETTQKGIRAWVDLLGIAAAALGILAAVTLTTNAVVAAFIIGLQGFVSGTIVEYVQDAFSNMTDFFVAFGGTVSDVWSDVTSTTRSWWNSIKSVFDTLKGYFDSTLFPVIQYLYNNIVKPIFTAVAAAAVVMWTAAKAIFNAWKTFFESVLFPVIRVLWDVFKTVFALIEVAVQTWWGTVQIVFKAVKTFFEEVLFPVIKAFYSGAIKPTFDLVAGAVKILWSGVKVIFDAWKKYFNDVVFPIINWLYDNVIKPVFEKAGSWIKDKWNNVIKPVFDLLRDVIVNKVAPAFQRGVDAIKTAWEKVKDAAKVPVKFVVDTVINKGIIDTWNKVAGFFHVNPIGHIPLPFASGGRVTGPGGPKDDRVPALLSDGEYVMPADKVSRYGTRLFDKLRSGAVKVSGDATQTVLRFAEGGSVSAVKAWLPSVDPLPYIWGGVGPGGYDCSGLVGEVWNRLTGHGSYTRRFTTSSLNANPEGFGFGPGTGKFTVGVSDSHMVGNLDGTGFEARGSQSGIFVGSGAQSAAGFPHVYHLTSVTGAYVPNGDLGPTWTNPFTDVKNLIIGKVNDLLGSMPDGGPFGDLVAKMPKLLADTITSLPVDLAKKVASGITDLAAAGLHAIGIPGFDHGGILQPGLNVVANNTGGYEHLVPAGAPAGGAGSGVHYHFAPGAITLDASRVRSLQDIITMMDGIRSTSRQYGAVPRSA